MYKKGEILLIPIPFTDLTSSKRRPVLVVSNNNYNNKTNDIVVVAITSNLASKDYSVMLTNSDLESGSLKLDSCIRADKIYTLSQNIVIKKFGLVKIETLDSVIDEVSELIGKISK